MRECNQYIEYFKEKLKAETFSIKNSKEKYNRTDLMKIVSALDDVDSLAFYGIEYLSEHMDEKMYLFICDFDKLSKEEIYKIIQKRKKEAIKFCEWFVEKVKDHPEIKDAVRNTWRSHMWLFTMYEKTKKHNGFSQDLKTFLDDINKPIDNNERYRFIPDGYEMAISEEKSIVRHHMRKKYDKNCGCILGISRGGHGCGQR